MTVLRRWRYERSALRHGKTGANFRAPGRQAESGRTTRYDGALVRVIDFEKALAELDAEEVTMLVRCEGDRDTHAIVAAELNMSPRCLSYKLPSARKKLAEVLDRRGLL